MPLLNAIGIVVSDTARSIPLAKRNRDRVRHVVRAELAERRWNFTLSKPRPVATAVASTLRPSLDLVHGVRLDADAPSEFPLAQPAALALVRESLTRGLHLPESRS